MKYFQVTFWSNGRKQERVMPAICASEACLAVLTAFNGSSGARAVAV